MRTVPNKELACLFCMALMWAWAPTVPVAGETSSILSRLQTIDDPELGELLRVAIENLQERYGPNEDMLQETIRNVTQSYAQIRLLDRQIEQIDRQVGRAGPHDLLHELILARAELDSKRTIELANLRKTMWIVPTHAFGRRPVSALKSWWRLDVLDERVYVLKGKRPFRSSRNRETYEPVAFTSTAEALRILQAQLAKPGELPIRIDIYRMIDAIDLSEEIREKIVALIKQAGRTMEAEVHLDDDVRQRGATLTLYIEGGKIATVQGYSGTGSGRRRHLDDFLDPNKFDEYARRSLTSPQVLPAQFHLTHDQRSQGLAERVATSIRSSARDLGIDGYVEVISTLRERDLESRFLGTWRTVHEGETLGVEISPHRRCLLSEDSETHPAGWALDGAEILITSGDGAYRGHIDSEGNLVIVADDEVEITLKKVE